MIVIRTAEEMARALDSPLNPEIKQILQARRDMLAEYEGFSLEELALFVVVQPGDELAKVEAALARTLVQFDGGPPTFAIGAESVIRHRTLFELLFVLSDDGFGLVLLVPNTGDVDPVLRIACERELSLLDSGLP